MSILLQTYLTGQVLSQAHRDKHVCIPTGKITASMSQELTLQTTSTRSVVDVSRCKVLPAPESTFLPESPSSVWPVAINSQLVCLIKRGSLVLRLIRRVPRPLRMIEWGTLVLRLIRWMNLLLRQFGQACCRSACSR